MTSQPSDWELPPPPVFDKIEPQTPPTRTTNSYPDAPTQRAEFKILPASCRCGGTHAWVAEIDGVIHMLGCVCHTDLLRLFRSRL